MQTNDFNTSEKEIIGKPIYQRLLSQLNSQLPFVIYREPNKNEVWLYYQENDKLHYTDDWKEKAFVFAPFENSEKAVLIPMENTLNVSYIPKKRLVRKNHISSDPFEKKDYIQKLTLAIETLANSKIDKLVLSRKVKVEVPSTLNAIEVFFNILDTYMSAFCYWWFHPKVGMWMGATPEQLFALQGKKFRTMALAGTKLNRVDSSKEWGVKELNEQQIVTDYIEKVLGPITEELRIGKPETTKAGNLLHLRTIVTGSLKNASVRNLIVQLHPTPAVCGFPKQESKDYLLKNEGYDRKFYTGFLGLINDDLNKANMFVNLRCMEWKDDCVYLYVGGGITSDSNPESEWEETNNKLGTMLSVL